ncbi:ParB/RepB/Spo0J family partition protein [Clostridium botulinum]|uniref:ParB/RepB/Spo0J family partition protein n=1 Tax=Clostridium TaxID=1485 RepID=UPI0013C95F06|nr:MULTISPECIES: ParB/RepB/Spo0J family partition protein [unclassified Clostridium]NFG42639.1 ParB/RepB/Spo0J family partition protein [Clostridium botulinum]MBZ9693169.1 ParB/RepB/Spo0J family partition protein [Clostridium sp. M14]NFI55171.1 ParB/RepB/Spo0J family partition protein [Clostridium botulinum]NFI93801.1 ParB/RepB/Spo0J family partition protein [Clostridium botulinum]NFO92146.1 ParB/RepB/Spo0J family partition protein [Clostridium botulinum]
MVKKFGLGKGLGALIPDEIDENVKQENIIDNSKSNNMLISLNKIRSDKEQPRKAFDSEKIVELAQSIKQHGIIQPLIVRQVNKSEFVIVAGERRWRAAKIAGLKELPCITMDISDKDILEISLIENIQREDLNPIEEALAYKKLLEDFRITQSELSNRIGKSRVTIANTMRLMNLDERVQQYLIEGIITEGHGRALLAIENNDLQYEFAQKVIDNKLSVRELERLIKNISIEKANKELLRELNPYYKDVRNQLQDYFGTKVNILDKKNKGKIEIEYYSEEDLQRILDIINIQ